MWRYKQSSGVLVEPGGLTSYQGYSGYGEYKNKPEFQNEPHLGCLPRGLYIMLFGVNHPHLGPEAIQLIPHPDNKMFGRTEFFMHGVSKDNPATPEDESKLSSHGCLCFHLEVRQDVDKQDDRVLEVVE